MISGKITLICLILVVYVFIHNKQITALKVLCTEFYSLVAKLRKVTRSLHPLLLCGHSLGIVSNASLRATNKEALIVLCSVVKQQEAGSRKRLESERETRDVVEGFPYFLLSALAASQLFFY